MDPVYAELLKLSKYRVCAVESLPAGGSVEYPVYRGFTDGFLFLLSAMARDAPGFFEVAFLGPIPMDGVRCGFVLFLV